MAMDGNELLISLLYRRSGTRTYTGLSIIRCRFLGTRGDMRVRNVQGQAAVFVMGRKIL